MRSFWVAAVLLGGVLVSEVQAQAVCGMHADIVNRLAAGFEEQVRASGLAADGNLVEVFRSKSGSWTIIYTQPGGLTCLVAVGRDWQQIEAVATKGRGT